VGSSKGELETVYRVVKPNTAINKLKGEFTGKS
jgi:hypothetical protein